jgi:hypothetical protein
MIDGTKVQIGGVERILAPLLLKTVRAFAKREAAIRALPADEIADAMVEMNCEMLLTSLQRNHPELKREDLDEHLDLPNFNALIMEAKKISGLVTMPGEAQRPAGNMTGPSSTGG